MKVPEKLYDGPYVGRQQWTTPDFEWLEDQYHTQGKSGEQIAREVGCRANIVRRWLRKVKIPLRSKMERDMRHSGRMLGEGNPAYLDGTDRGGSSKRCRRLLWRVEISEVCAWCGASVEDERLEAHHKDHNRRNDSLENLQWMCVYCHRLESYIWKLWKTGKIDLKCDGENRTMLITFRR